jgi:glycerophosphoryl diester phosphodiesterase
MHDPTIYRVTKKKGYVSEMTYNDLKKIKTPDNQIIPSLSDVFDLVQDKAEILLDVKDKESVSGIIKEIERRKAFSTYFFCDNPNVVVQAKTILPQLRYGMLFHALQPHHPRRKILTTYLGRTPIILVNYFRLYNFIKPYFLNVSSYYATQSFVNYHHKRSVKIFVWGVRSREQMIKLIKNGADALVNDRPDIMNEIQNFQV